MSSLSSKDRVSLCSFTFSDGRRCRTPRLRNHPHFCPDHAQKEARARTAQQLGDDLAYFFSGNYLSACDLTAALARLLPAVVRGDIKPRTARTVAYLAQTLLQAINASRHEYTNAFGSDAWRHSIRNSVNQNHDHLYPPAPHRSGGLQAGPVPQPEHPGQPQPQPAPVHPAPSPHTSLPPTRAEFVQQVIAKQNSPRPPQTFRRSGREPGSAAANHIPPPAETPVNCHSERSEEPASSSSPACHPGGSDGSHPIPATQSAPSVAPAAPPAGPEQGRRVNPSEPNRNAPRLNLDDTHRIPPDSKLL